MKKTFVIIITLFLTACQTENSRIEDADNSQKLPIDTANIETEQLAKSKVLLKASFTEPYMYAEISSDKAIFTFPEKDTLVLLHHFDSLMLSKPFYLFKVQDSTNFTFLLTPGTCIHPGSGEEWPIKAKFEINKVVYQGCAMPL